MLKLLKDVALDSTATFQNIRERATISHAAGLVVLSGLLGALPPVIQARDPITNGAVMLVAWRTATAVGLWLLAGLVAHVVAGKLMGGVATFRTTLLALGMAYLALVLSAVADIALSYTEYAGSPYLLVFHGWFAMLAIIAIREVHAHKTQQAVIAALSTWIVIFSASVVIVPVEWAIRPRLYRNPFPAAGKAWQEEDLPTKTVNVLPNADFSDPVPTTPEEITDEAPLWVFGATLLPSPTAQDKSGQPRDARMSLKRMAELKLANALEVDYDYSASAGVDGDGALMLRRPGALGAPIVWAWAYFVPTELSRATILEVLEQTTDGAEKDRLKKDLERLDKRGLIDSVPGDRAYCEVSLKGEDVVAANLAIFVQTKDSATPVFHCGEMLSGTFDWTTRRLTVSLPENTMWVMFCPVLWAGGSLTIDNARLLVKHREPEPAETEADNEAPGTDTPDPTADATEETEAPPAPDTPEPADN